ncbi:histidine phosphatase family protein [Alicyclobacillus fodiniaquatilis]|uniref:Histidine phosphatase family protein n=1 Tax=Alicyclobacillus fodiniaquatilis TaxID=1661150 RepID=A0ABW4JRV8_9BACL
MIFARHAPTLANEQFVMIGRTDTALHVDGHLCARRLANTLVGLPICAVITSPLARARQTADAIASLHTNCVRHMDERLMEIDLGVVDGVSSFEAYELHKAAFDEALSPDTVDFAFPSGERWSSAAGRMEQAVSDWSAEYSGQTLCIVTHGALLGFWRCGLEQRSLGHFRAYQPKHASFSVAQKQGSNWQILRWNDTSHLQ